MSVSVILPTLNAASGLLRSRDGREIISGLLPCTVYWKF